MADIAHELTDKELEKMEQHLSAIYSRAEKELQEKADKYFKRFEELDAEKRALVDSGKLTEKEYKRWRQNKVMTGRHWKQMKEQAAQELAKVNETALEYVNGRLPGVYAINYNHSAEEIERLSQNAISFEHINKRAVENLVKAGDTSLLPFKKLDSEKDVQWNMGKVNSEVLQGIIQGESIPKIAKRIRSVTEANRVSSVRAARTIVNGTENKARHDAGVKASEKGVIMGKCWIATNDNRTRDWHAQAWADYGDKSNAVPIDDPFIVNGEKMMYPGDKSASASNVYNCRCSHKNVVKGFTSILPPEKRGKIKVTFT